MERFFGFDLGDAESAVSVLRKASRETPRMLKIRSAESFITAYARTAGGDLIIGEEACYHPDAAVRRIRFKSRFLTDPDSASDVKAFAAGVLGQLYTDGSLVQGEDACFYVGCPAGWEKADRERYRQIFERVGYPPVKIVSESRAALVSACQSRHLQVGYDILSHPVLVVDIGSSTTDFAFITAGREVELKTAGEVALGGGIMDEILLEEAVSAAPDEKRIREILRESEPWKNYCEFAARRLKEKYFSDEAFWKENECRQIIRFRHKLFAKLTLEMNERIARDLTEKGVERLGGKSFREVFTESLREVREKIGEQQPELLFLTGGVSKLAAVSDWCREIFPEAVVITGAEPEFSVSKGLAWCGSIDEELREFRLEIENLKDSTTVEQIVSERIGDLYREAVECLTEPILKEAVLPVIERWREGSVEKLGDIDGVLQEEIAAWLHTDSARALLMKPVAAWLRTVSYALEEYTVPICVRHNVPYRALSLSSYLSVSEIDIRVEAKDVFAVEEITWMIDTIISILVGLLCGGSGIAVISSGLPGIVAGAVISLFVLLLGKEKMQEVILNANIPQTARKLMPRRYFESRLGRISEEVKENFRKSLETDKNDEILDRMVQDVSAQIENCLIKMAEVVEIPLG